MATLILIPLVVATGGIQSVWAAKGSDSMHYLLTPDSPTWSTTSDGYTSPDGVWTTTYLGYGTAKVVADGSGDKVLKIVPKIDDGALHAALIKSNGASFAGIHGKMKVRLDSQRGSESWDSFWAMLAYTDDTHHVYLTLKTGGQGWEVGKRDHNHPGEDLHEVIAEGTAISGEMGHWYNVEWWIYPNSNAGALHIKVVVDGTTLVDKNDDQPHQGGPGTSSFFMDSAKKFAAYSEQSGTSWKDISVGGV